MKIIRHLRWLLRKHRPLRIYAARLGESIFPPEGSVVATCTRCRHVVTLDLYSQAMVAIRKTEVICLRCGVRLEPEFPSQWGYTLRELEIMTDALFPPGTYRTFSAWGRGGRVDTLVEGPGPPRFADGTPQEPGQTHAWSVLGRDVADVMTAYDVLQGWEGRAVGPAEAVTQNTRGDDDA